VGGEELKVTLWCPMLPATMAPVSYPTGASPPSSPTVGAGGNPAPASCCSSSINMHGFALGGAGDAALLEDAVECEEVCGNAQQLAELFGTVLSVRVVREPEVHLHPASSHDEKVRPLR
jgi:hypothetical protein